MFFFLLNLWAKDIYDRIYDEEKVYLLKTHTVLYSSYKTLHILIRELHFRKEIKKQVVKIVVNYEIFKKLCLEEEA